jgi:hypothetical protein
MLGRIKRENEAVPTDPLAIPPAPLLSLKRFHIALQWIVAHLSKTTGEEGFSIRRKFFELFGGLF